MISSISQYLLAVKHIDKMSRNLATMCIYPIFESGKSLVPKCHAGNSVIVFEVMCDGKKKALRVYTRQHPNLRAIYGDSYYPKEILINCDTDRFLMADAVLCDWYEGVTLQTKIEELCKNPVKMAYLSQMFEAFAIELLNKRWAHGDLKPENIIFSQDGLHLIDLDASYHEGFSQEDCIEIGTRQFQHPQRSRHNFDRNIDDYPIALITTVLAALSLDKSLGVALRDSDYLLIKPELAVKGCDEILTRIEELFAECGDARHYRIARLLHSPNPTLPQLKTFMEATCTPTSVPESLSLEYCNGYWGYAENGRYVIPPIYDLAFEFKEGMALVRIGDVWHFIDAAGNVVITCGRGRGIKSFRGGVTRIIREDGEFAIYRDGRIERV